MRSTRGGIVALVALGASVGLIACGDSDDSASGGKKLEFALTDAGCDPAETSVAAGPVDFDVTNEGTSNVTELEVLDGDRILGEVENLSDGLSGSFSLTLEQGEYTLYCPGGETERGTLTVTKGEGPSAKVVGEQGAVDRYRVYVERNADELVTGTEAFVAAVKAGDVAKAKSLYPDTRVPYERIEPVAESFGPLDPAIDARKGDVPDSEFRGFHRIERALWVDDTAKGMAPVADRLLADVRSLQRKVKTVDLQAAQIANGANELLGEVSATKLTGEEERYSHTDLWDIDANVDGARAAFGSVAPILRANDPKLAPQIDARFNAAIDDLDQYRRGNGWVSYEELTEADTRALSRQIDALAEPLSQVASRVSG